MPRTTKQDGDIINSCSNNLPLDWDSIPLKNILKEVDLRVNVDVIFQDLVVLSLTKNFGLIPQTQRFEKRIAKTDVGKYKVLRKNWLVYNPYVIWEGAIHILKNLEAGIVSPAYLTWEIVNGNPQYIDYLLKTPRILKIFLQYSSGVVQRRRAINKKTFLNISLPFPPLLEQKNIATVLSTLQDTIANTESVIESLRNLKKAMMRHLFTYGPVAIEEAEQVKLKETEIGMMPDDWEMVKLGDVSTISTGTTPATDVKEYYGGDIPFIKTSGINNCAIYDSTTYITQKAVEEYRLKIYPTKTIFMAMYGQGKTRGQVSLLQIPATTSQNTAAIIPQDYLYPEWLWYYLMSIYDNLRKDGIQGHISHLNLGYVKKFSLPLPPLPVQRKIAEILSALDARIQAEEKKKQSLDSLFKTLLELVMTGKIRITSLETTL